MNFQMKLNKKVLNIKLKLICKLDFTGVVVSSQEPKEKLSNINHLNTSYFRFVLGI